MSDRNEPFDLDRTRLEQAARLALRGHGHAEPNPSVGCLVADAEGRLVGQGRTAICGGPHAEVVALRRAGRAARGGTAWVTLEPCNHHGRTPPCVDALVAAGVARVVVGRRDPNPVAAGGLDRLRAAGIEVTLREEIDAVVRLHAGFEQRVATGRPWLLAKWAETFDGDLVAPPDVARTISSPASHRLVHRERGRVDAILTGIGTVLADDPRLDARVRRARRTPIRVVVDPALAMPIDARMLAVDAGPVIVAVDERRLTTAAATASALADRGVSFIPMPAGADRLPDGRRLEHLLTTLARDHDVATILTEAGPGLLGALFDADLVDAALVFTAPHHFATRTTSAPPRDRLDSERFDVVWEGDRGGDQVRWWQRR